MSEMIDCPKCGEKIEAGEVIKQKIEAQITASWETTVKDAVTLAKKEAQNEIDNINKKLEQANANELILRRERTELEQRSKDIDLEVQRKLDEEKNVLESRIAFRISENHRAKDAEKDKRLADTLTQVEDLKRRIEQGSQQAQGETFEAELEDMLITQFPYDSIESVEKGVKGGDILQTVRNRVGADCGKILWEVKRTKAWSEGWLAKVKSDARTAKADICLIATETMPKDMQVFGERDGVWVSPPESCIGLADALRMGIMRAAKERYLQEGKKDKAILIYEYLTGVEFRGRVEAIVESYRVMKSDLESEKRAMEKVWAKRDKQISMVSLSLAGMHGEIEAIAAGELPAIPVLQLGVDK